MKEYLVKIPDANEEVLVAVMEKFGAEIAIVTDSDKLGKKMKNYSKLNSKKEKAEEKVPATWLFGKWKGNDIDPVTFRKEVWRKK